MSHRSSIPFAVPMTLSDDDLTTVTGGHHHKHHKHKDGGGKPAGGGGGNSIAQNAAANVNVYAPNNSGVIEVIVNVANGAGIAA